MDLEVVLEDGMVVWVYVLCESWDQQRQKEKLSV